MKTINLDYVYDKDPSYGGKAIGFKIIYNYENAPSVITYPLTEDGFFEALDKISSKRGKVINGIMYVGGYFNDIYDRALWLFNKGFSRLDVARIMLK